MRIVLTECKRTTMPEKVLIYSRFPKAHDGAHRRALRADGCRGQAAGEVFTAEQLAGVRAMITAGGTPLGADDDGHCCRSSRAIVCYGTGYDGVDLAAAAKRGHRGRPQSGGECRRRLPIIAVTLMLAVTRRLLAGRRLCAQRQLGRRQTVAADAPAARQSRPPGRRLRHGRDRPQDRRARRGLRDRGRLFQPQPARRAVSAICRAWKRWRNGAAC